MSDIQAVSITQYCEIRSSKRVFAKDYHDSGVPFYRGKEIIEKYNGALSVSTELFISEEKFTELCAKLGAPQPGDLLLTSVGTLGVPYVVSPGERFYFKDGNLTWFRNFNGLDSTYLYYWLVSPTGKAELAKATIGSSQSAFTIVLLKDMQIACPPLPTQRKIASILSAYDDLIENNTRRIAILEEMAQAIHREWFVNFRFPGHENVKLVESPLGQIPEGWDVVPLLDIAEVKYGKNLPTKQLDSSAPFPVYGAAKIIGRHSEYTREERTLICGCRGSVGEMQITLPQCFVTNNSFTFDLPNKLFFWLYHTLKWRGLRDVVSGSAQPQITLKGISSVQLASPEEASCERFQKEVQPLFQQKYCLEKKNENLLTARDLLLPKLISGKLDVENLDIDVGLATEALDLATA